MVLGKKFAEFLATSSCEIFVQHFSSRGNNDVSSCGRRFTLNRSLYIIYLTTNNMPDDYSRHYSLSWLEDGLFTCKKITILIHEIFMISKYLTINNFE